jgi:hypothetical protein
MEYSCDCRNVVVVPKDASASKGKGKENAGTVSVERVETVRTFVHLHDTMSARNSLTPVGSKRLASVRTSQG